MVYVAAMSTESGVLTVAVVNDYEVVVRGVAGLLEPFTDQLRVVELDVDLPGVTPVDIALYDTFAMEGTGSALLRTMLSREYVAALVFYTWNVSPGLVAEAHEAGISGVLSKSLSAAELARCPQRIHRGELVISPQLPSGEAVAPGDWPGRDYGLTRWEAEIAALITQGLSNSEIVERTRLSINSVKPYIRSVYRTMGVTSRSQAARWCMERGLDNSPTRITMNRGIAAKEH